MSGDLERIGEDDDVPTSEIEVQPPSLQEQIRKIGTAFELDRLQLCRILLYSNPEWLDEWQEPGGVLPEPIQAQVQVLNELVDLLRNAMRPSEIVAWIQKNTSAFGDKTPFEVAAAGNTKKVVAALERHLDGIPILQ